MSNIMLDRGYIDPFKKKERVNINMSKVPNGTPLSLIGASLNANVGSWFADSKADFGSFETTVVTDKTRRWIQRGIRPIEEPKTIDSIVGEMAIGDFATRELLVEYYTYAGKVQLNADFLEINQAKVAREIRKHYLVSYVVSAVTGYLEEAQATGEDFPIITEKQKRCLELLEKKRNEVGFYGAFSESRNGAVFGLLNNPFMSPVIVGKVSYKDMTFEQRWDDLTSKIQMIKRQLGDNFSLQDKFIYILPSNLLSSYLSPHPTTNRQMDVMFKEIFPNIEVIFSEKMEGAFGGLDLAMLIDMRFAGSDGTDSTKTPLYQIVAEKARMKFDNVIDGDHRMAFMNNLGGVVVTRPQGIIRWTVSTKKV